MEMVILRTNRPVSGDRLAVPVSALSHEPDQLSIVVVDLSTKDLLRVRRDPQVIDAAPPMPMVLIEPVAGTGEAESSATTGQPPEVSWGVQAVGAAASNFTGEGVVVAVLDTGIDPNYAKHPAFSGVEIVAKNFTQESDGDEKGHGTHCAGTIFGRTTDECRIGVAPGVGKALIGKILGTGGGSTDAVLKGILWAYQEGAQVISMSLGIDFPGFREQLATIYPQKLATSMALAGYRANVRLFDRLSQVTSGRDGFVQGAVVVAAAGNESARKVNPIYRVTTAPPAAAELFLSVAALEKTADPAKPYAVASFSNTGARVAVPGVDSRSAKVGGGLVSMSGTSMATPHVAGAAALWAQKLMKQGGFQATRVIDRLERSTKELPYLDPDDVGLGLVQAP
jgi:subtilisin family serine protease